MFSSPKCLSAIMCLRCAAPSSGIAAGLFPF
jgi:hypothetical protein